MICTQSILFVFIASLIAFSSPSRADESELLQKLHKADQAVCVDEFSMKDVEAEIAREKKSGGDLQSLHDDRDRVSDKLFRDVQHKQGLINVYQKKFGEKPPKETCRELDAKSVADQTPGILSEVKGFFEPTQTGEIRENQNSGERRESPVSHGSSDGAGKGNSGSGD
jgi:hypothetical protein